MAYNTRRSGEGHNAVGGRRNPPLSNNFMSGGQLPPQNRPQMQPRAQGQPQPNGNFRPQQQRFSGPAQQQKTQGPAVKTQQQQQQPPQQQQQQPPQKQQATPQQQQATPQQQQATPQHQQATPQQQQPPPQQQQPSSTQDPNDEFLKEELDQLDDQAKKKPFWATKLGKISRKERQRRRNVRLSKMLQPKNAVMILNELVKSATYTVADFPQPSEGNQYTATVLVDGVSHVGHGRSKMEAKSMAAEHALKYIVKNRQFSALKKDEDGDVKMEVAEDGTPTLPWQHVASFALYKLLHSWGEDPNQARVSPMDTQDNAMGQPPQNKPAKKMPHNATHMNPLMLLNQMLPHAQFEELGRTGTPPNVVFTFNCMIDDKTFTGIGSNKKSAKKMAAFAVCHQVLGVQYAAEVYTPLN